jgi:hypothetical protein
MCLELSECAGCQLQKLTAMVASGLPMEEARAVQGPY